MKVLKQAAAVVLSVALLLVGLSSGGGIEGQAAAATGEEFRGMWVASIYNLDYPTKGTTDAAKLKREADEVLKNCADMGMNAVVLQVRPSCDALYPSAIYPWSQYLTGKQGAAPNGSFDPLKYWVERAHTLGLELHAWINPFRVTKAGEKEFAALAAKNPAVLHPEWLVVHENNYYLNPGLPEVRELVIAGAEELARNYDIDGIHLDDYFYPGTDFDDGEAYAAYGKGFSNIGNWRRYNVNLLIKTLGERIHAIDPDLSYGISPSGVWADKGSLKEGSNTTGRFESYFKAYADSRKWVKEGWIDYICPQIYWVIDHKTMDYATIARWWAETVRGTEVALYIGMADYQAGAEKETSVWHGTTAIEDMLALNDTLPQVTGEIHFRYQLMAKNAALVSLYQRHYAAQVTATPQRPRLDTKNHNGYLEGDKGLFRPDDDLTRAEAVTILARLSVGEDGAALYAPGAASTGFSDMKVADWSAPYVAFGKTYGVVSGYPDGTFRPQNPVSRAELIKLVSAYFDLPVGQIDSGFTDVAATHWAAGVVGYAKSSGWLDCFGAQLRPDQTATRAEAAFILNRAMGRQPDVAWLAEHNEKNPFSDLNSLHWAYYDILEASLTHSFTQQDTDEVWSQGDAD